MNLLAALAFVAAISLTPGPAPLKVSGAAPNAIATPLVCNINSPETTTFTDVKTATTFQFSTHLSCNFNFSVATSTATLSRGATSVSNQASCGGCGVLDTLSPTLVYASGDAITEKWDLFLQQAPGDTNIWAAPTSPCVSSVHNGAATFQCVFTRQFTISAPATPTPTVKPTPAATATPAPAPTNCGPTLLAIRPSPLAVGLGSGIGQFNSVFIFPLQRLLEVAYQITWLNRNPAANGFHGTIIGKVPVPSGSSSVAAIDTVFTQPSWPDRVLGNISAVGLRIDGALCNFESSLANGVVL